MPRLFSPHLGTWIMSDTPGFHYDDYRLYARRTLHYYITPVQSNWSCQEMMQMITIKIVSSFLMSWLVGQMSFDESVQRHSILTRTFFSTLCQEVLAEIARTSIYI